MIHRTKQLRIQSFNVYTIRKWIWTNKIDITYLLLIAFFLPLFFYNLGNFSLVDYDEAWFAEVALNIIKNKNLFILTFNNDRFLEHPPFGFLLMALSFLIFGVNEFAARFFSAILAFGSLLALYFIGKNLLNRTVGFCSAIILTSCVWFVFRVRSGNLDTIFLFFYLLSFLASMMIHKNPKWIYIFTISLTLLFLTKTLIGLSVLVPSGILLWFQRSYLKRFMIIKSLLLFLLLVAPWIILNYLQHGKYFLEHLVLVGLRPFGRIQPNYRDLLSSLTFQYLHYGIRKWYYFALISAIILLPFSLLNKYILSIESIVLLLLYGFITNVKTEIWHLIPVYPFLALLISFCMWKSVFLFVNLFRLNPRHTKYISSGIVTTLIVILAIYQIYQFRAEVKLFDRDVSGLAYTASAARNYSEHLYLNADYFLPSAVFYSQKPVILIKGYGYPLGTLKGFIERGKRPYLLLTEEWKLHLDQIDPSTYEIKSKFKEYVLLYAK